ncbi:sugar kinase [Pseudalkalibacillus hwajinpoensis]|uniref:sugar kinase n=1 Tax=Guptibacillus hwajinpoensis TaxID=208199 RepID=UPI001CD1B00F|nr:sugar kinase [Pseudalkalibacillus hwajinpoensis]MCA0991345.1 sugar kinase [Pseudalkalibacillus hwajinpoensis]
MDVVTIGESMVLFTPQSSPRMRYAETYTRKFGGAETNVAIGLARLGHEVGWISKVGNDEFGKALLSFVRGEAIDVRQVKIDASAPTGIYFKEIRNSEDVRVEYYRKGSAASKLEPSDLNESYLSQATYLHISGITPALSNSCYEMINKAITLAKKHDVTVVFDPNLRRKLWGEERAREVLLDIASKSDIILPGVEEGTFLFGEENPNKLGNLFLNLGAKTVILKAGAEGAYYFSRYESGFVPAFPIASVVDPVGAGDGFAAGFISGLLQHRSLKQAVEKGNAVGALVTQVEGDFEGLPDEDEVQDFINNKERVDIIR